RRPILHFMVRTPAPRTDNPHEYGRVGPSLSGGASHARRAGAWPLAPPVPAAAFTRRGKAETMDPLQDDIPQRLLEAGLIDERAHLQALQQQKNLGGTVTANLVKTG